MGKVTRGSVVTMVVIVALLIVVIVQWHALSKDPFHFDVVRGYKGTLPSCVQRQLSAGQALYRVIQKDPVQYKCQNQALIKNEIDGYRYYCRDKGFEVSAPCLVYSFGIAYDFAFDDFFGNKGCDVFSFDPSMDTPDHRRSRQVMFYQIGLGGEDTDRFEARLDSYVKTRALWKMRTLKTLVTTLNHTNRIIDVLKVDIECSEWNAVRNMIDSGILKQVKTFFVEWHIFKDCPAREDYPQMLTLLADLQKAGFQSFNAIPQEPKLYWDTFNVQTEFAYLNTRFLKR
ncbi:putative methyltransferase-like protein 24 isoform X1 [Babylonia areolata]|uniref:putative methyltransferase-like protein 24 isoform X1 n=1 Tax=Babylonia areolata TaxID=304850 RepID=UPI003FD5932E